jgi:hypothetical protein
LHDVGLQSIAVRFMQEKGGSHRLPPFVISEHGSAK